MRKLLGLTLLCIFWSSALHAQTNPCDTPSGNPTSGSSVAGTTLTLSLCASPVGTDGSPIVTVQGFTIYDNGVSTAPTWNKGATSTVGARLTQWTVSWVTPSTVGVHTLQVTETGADSTGVMKESAKSVPFALTVTKAPTTPIAPVGLFAQ